MIHGAVLALANKRGAGEDDREHADAVDDAHDAGEPGGHDIWIVHDADVEIDWRRGNAFRVRQKILDFGHDDLLRIVGAEAALHHHGCVDVDLKRRISAAQHVALEVRGNVDHKGVFADVH